MWNRAECQKCGERVPRETMSLITVVPELLSRGQPMTPIRDQLEYWCETCSREHDVEEKE